MTAVFDGMAGVFNTVFGAPVLHTASGASAVEVQAIFREEPVEVLDDQGHTVLTIGPTLAVQKPTDQTIQFDDLINPGNGKLYRVENSIGNGSPASDAFVIFDLGEVDA
jgi:hypothetical protein